MKKYVKELIENNVAFEIMVGTPEVSKKVQQALLNEGITWATGDNFVKNLNSKYIAVGGKHDAGRMLKGEFAEPHKYILVTPEDILGADFEVGDKVRAWGLDGKVTADEKDSRPILVEFEGGEISFFTADGRHQKWHKEPSLILVERPIKKVLKSFYIWIDDKGNIMDRLMADDHSYVSGEKTQFPFGFGPHVKLPGTEVKIEVNA